MSHFKTISLDQISFENVSVLQNGFDPVLQAVDLQLPMDQTVVIQSSNPAHAISLLEVLAGRREPHSGRVFWNESNLFEQDEKDWTRHDLVGCYFENQRPDPKIVTYQLFKKLNGSAVILQDIIEHFDFAEEMSQVFQSLSYEKQKLCLLIAATLKNPQMLILEDPASGLSEQRFLQYLDWVQRSQRMGHLRHLFMTNHHPAALRHLSHNIMYLEDGLIYLEEEEQKTKKAVHF
jgi:putative ABC transport system ATP-binding protein